MALPTLDHTNWRFKTNILQPYTRKSLTFNGSSKYVSFGNVLGFERTDTFSISFWVKWTTATTMMMVTKTGDAPSYPGYDVFGDGLGRIGFSLYSNYATPNYAQVYTNSSYNNGAWRHVVVTYSGTSLTSGMFIYVDGAQVATTVMSNTLTGSVITTNEFRVGARATSSTPLYFIGAIDEVSVYNIALTSTQVSEIYNYKNPVNLSTLSTAGNILSWWRMGDNDTFPTITDNSSGGINGTMMNMAVGDITASWPTSGNVDWDMAVFLKLLKDSLKTGTGWTDGSGAAQTVTSPWTVVASSNRTVANTSDNWNSYADMYGNSSGSAHSWIILRQTGITGSNFELCIDLNHPSSRISAFISWTGFNLTSLSVLNRPTAPDELAVSNTTYPISNSSFSTVLNVAMTDDGQMTRVWANTSGSCQFFASFEQPKNATASWSNPAIVMWTSQTGPTYVSYNDNPWTNCKINNTNVAAYITSEFYNGQAVGQSQTTVNSMSNEYQLNTPGIASVVPWFYGKHGDLSDIWWISVTPANGDTMPATGTLKQFIVVPNMVLPWNQSTPVLT